MSCASVGIAFLIGAALCLRLNVLILYVAMAVLTVALWVSNFAHHNSFVETLLIDISLVVALQVGYLFSIVLQAVASSFYERHGKRIFDGHGTRAHRFVNKRHS
jgi:hypothetical protein